MRNKAFLLALLLIGLANAQADTTYFTRATYDAAHPGNYVTDFDNYGPDGTLYNSGLTVPSPLGDISFLGLVGLQQPRVEILDANHFGFSGSGNFVLFTVDADFMTDSLLITLPTDTFSFGTDMISPSPTVPEPYQFTLYSEAAVITTLFSPSITGSYTFVGYDSDAPITSIRVQINSTSGNSGPVLDNFTVVPEPATNALLALGSVVVLRILVRRRLG